MRNAKPSATACLIAASLGLCSRDPDRAPLVNPLAAELSQVFMKAYGMPASLFTSVLLKPWLRRLASGIERVTIPGIMLHYLVRKHFLDQKSREALDTGIRQVVVLGAGFDVLALSLHTLYPNAIFLEVDFPATQATKQKALSGRRLGPNLIFVPIDFTRENLATCLLTNRHYQSHKETLFIAEGVLMYLSQNDVNNLFSFIREKSGPGSRFAFTFMEPRDNGRVNFHNRSKAVDYWMSLRGEPFTWGIPRLALAPYLESIGFHQEELGTPQIFRERFLKTPRLAEVTLAEGEYVCVAKKQT